MWHVGKIFSHAKLSTSNTNSCSYQSSNSSKCSYRNISHHQLLFLHVQSHREFPSLSRGQTPNGSYSSTLQIIFFRGLQLASLASNKIKPEIQTSLHSIYLSMVHPLYLHIISIYKMSFMQQIVSLFLIEIQFSSALNYFKNIHQNLRIYTPASWPTWLMSTIGTRQVPSLTSTMGGISSWFRGVY